MKWNNEEISYLPYFINFFNNLNKNTIIISKRYEIPNLQMSILKNDSNDNLNLFLEKNISKFDTLNKKIINLTKTYNANYFDLNNFICNTKKKCKFIIQDKFKYLDYSHFTMHYGKIILNKSYKSLKNEFKKFP